tara:strand:+ start:628 stop:1728 length:1101 start_codon:yes stop_codon:yes gene_type:complete
MNIDIILPYKEHFTASNASAVSISVKNSLVYSNYKKDIKIFGQNVNYPMFSENFVGLNINRYIHFSKNISLIKSYLRKSNFNNEQKLIEIHNRPYLINYLYPNIKNNPLVLYFHNDPLQMQGSKKISERKEILNKVSGLVFVSEYLKERFLEGINKEYSKLHVIPNSLSINQNANLNKKKQVLFVGRIVREKGVEVYVEAIKNIAHKFPDWKFYLVGETRSRNKFFGKSFETNIINNFLKIGPNVERIGYIPNDDVIKLMEQSSILVVPSLWQEPFGLTAMEGLSNKMAVIANKVGGLADIVKENGILIENINVENLTNKLNELITNPNLILKIQERSWLNYKYDQKTISSKQDLIRKELYDNFKC